MPIATNSDKIDLSSEKKTEELADKILKKLKVGDVVFLYGEIGVGKTTFIKYLINGFQKENKLKLTEVTSPTFPLLNIYKNNEVNIYHADLYRLKNIDEINELGFYEMMESDNWFFVEWPELLYDLIDFPYTKIKINT